MTQTLKIKTRYQRMASALVLAESLQVYGDPKVANIAHEIVTLLGAPIGTLNNVLECFEPASKRAIAKLLATPSPEARERS